MGFFLRWLFAFVLITATYNPTGMNYVQWSMANYVEELPMTVFLGLLLTIGYIIYLRATLRSIGGGGMFLIMTVLCALMWVLHDWGLLAPTGQTAYTWMGIFALSCVLGIGLSWSIVRRNLSGQTDVDDVEE